MAKRFTDTGKWKKPFIRRLNDSYKLLWSYILDECDSAGIWQVDFEVAKIEASKAINEAEAKKLFAEKIIILDNGEKWFIPSFIEFQYGELKETNRAHTKAISTLKKYDLLTKDLKIKPLTSPLEGAKVEEEEKEEVKAEEEEKEKTSKKKKELIYPFDSEEFLSAWENWKEFRRVETKFKYKSIQSQQAALTELVNVADGKEDVAIAILMQSIAYGWTGFYELKNKQNENTGKKGQQRGNNGSNSGKVLNEDYKRELANRMASDTSTRNDGDSGFTAA